MRALAAPRRAGADTALAAAIVAHAAAHGVTAEVVEHRARPWASATFTGARHRVSLAATGPLAAWLALLPEAEWTLRGHLVADLAVVPGAPVVVEALTIEAA